MLQVQMFKLTEGEKSIILNIKNVNINTNNKIKNIHGQSKNTKFQCTTAEAPGKSSLKCTCWVQMVQSKSLLIKNLLTKLWKTFTLNVIRTWQCSSFDRCFDNLQIAITNLSKISRL